MILKDETDRVAAEGSEVVVFELVDVLAVERDRTGRWRFESPRM